MNININKFQHFPFHLVDPSPWPILLSFSMLNMAVAAVLYFHGFSNGGILLTIGFFLTCFGMILWFRDVITEGTYLGHHTKEVKNGLMLGIILFIISEVFAFLSVFWAFFHSSLSPAIEIGGSKRIKLIEEINNAPLKEIFVLETDTSPIVSDIFINSPLEPHNLILFQDQLINILSTNLIVNLFMVYLVFMLFLVFTIRFVIDSEQFLIKIKKLPFGKFLHFFVNLIISTWTKSSIFWIYTFLLMLFFFYLLLFLCNIWLFICIDLTKIL